MILKRHAVWRMAKRKILLRDLAHVLEVGEVIEWYPDDQPLPSKLLLGFCGERPIHVVAANHPNNPEDTYIITVYEPKKDEWDSTFRKRLKS